jgi:predicted nucleic acid-binding protein
VSRAFIDSNVLIYAFSSDPRSARAIDVLRQGGSISVQSLNEFANAARRKLKLDWQEVHDGLDAIQELCASPIPLDHGLHMRGIALAEQYKLSVYDGMIVAAAIACDCDTLYSEDMHAGLTIDGRLRIVNPFA